MAPSAHDRHSPTGFSFVRRYLTGIFLIICLIILSVFWGFSYKAGFLIKEQLLRQGHAFFQEIVLTREWAAHQGGVYVRLKPGEQPNPYLLKVPNLKVVITDENGEKYHLKNPALMTREISEIAAEKGVFQFHITSLKPLNPANTPDAFERAALQEFERGKKESFLYENRDGAVYYRYMAPLMVEKPCLKCHAHQGYREGDTRGGISVTITATEMMQQLRENRILLIVSALGIVALVFAVIYFISSVFIKNLRVAEERLVDMATKDFLTGLLNRREIFNRLAGETSRFRRHSQPLSFIMIDIDHFKKINDTYGHHTGDIALKTVSHCMRDMLRDYDMLARYGGEEFLVATPATNAEAARELAERLRLKVMELEVFHDPGKPSFRLTISAGVAQMQDDEDVDRVLSRADAALYRAKEQGRNRVELA